MRPWDTDISALSAGEYAIEAQSTHRRLRSDRCTLHVTQPRGPTSALARRYRQRMGGKATRILGIGHRSDASVNRWIAILRVSGHPPGVMIVEPVGSHAEANEAHSNTGALTSTSATGC